MVQTPMTRERLFALRETIAQLENENVPGLLKAARKGAPAGFEPRAGNEDKGVSTHVLPLGIAALDDILQGGLPLGGLTEIRAAGNPRRWGCHGVCPGARRPLPVCPSRRSCLAHSLDRSGNDGRGGGSSLMAGGCRPMGWTSGAASSAALAPSPIRSGLLKRRSLYRSSGPSFWRSGEIRPQFGLNESRRLHMRARTGHVPIFLLRQAGEEEASSALFRFLVAPAPTAGRPLPDGSMLAGSIGNPVFRVTVEKSRAFAPLELLMEWSSHARSFRHFVPETAASPAKFQPAHSVAELPAPAGRPGGADEMGRIMAFQKAS